MGVQEPLPRYTAGLSPMESHVHVVDSDGIPLGGNPPEYGNLALEPRSG